ncbi:MAG: S-layer homology domain-containing protein, partial [Oscillospiraceae bacterium]|nr:S-layer homology domain-containing protein [Oscillospiraceae bacterium]
MKKGLTRRMLAFLLTLAMVLSLLPMAVFADSRTNPGLYAEPDAEHPFTDVPEGKYYYDAVYWAYNHDPRITTGSSGTTFSPNDPCTREQVVTFLWRANGEPEPTATESSFTDVPEGKYYTKAVLWAVEKEITAGETPTTFNPKGGCTREQAVTFLWRAMGKPTPAATTENPFTDVKEGKYYYEAVLWAYENGITSGATSTTFNPKGACTRAQIVTFLFRTFSLAEDLSGKTIILHTNDTHGA